MQNATPRTLTRTKTYEHLSPVLASALYIYLYHICTITITAAHVVTAHTTYILCHTVYTLFIYIYSTIMHILCTLLLCTSG